MRRSLLLPLLVVVLLLAGCGGGHSRSTIRAAVQPSYQTRYGVQAHSPTFGIPPTRLSLVPSTASAKVPTREMYDVVNVSAVPHGVFAVAGYLQGNWPTYRPLVIAFPSAVHVPISIGPFPVYRDSVSPSIRMVCLDIEPGDANPSVAGAWDKGELALGVIPCDYANLSTMPAVKASIAASHLSLSQVELWDADWTFHAHLDAGYQATQWTDHGPQGQNYDETSASLGFLGIHPKPLEPVCYSHRISRSACSAAKKKVASDQLAASASYRAYAARGCPVLSQRVSWFSTRLKQHPKFKTARRRRALSASRTAYRHRSCAVFNQRDSYFTNAAKTIAEAH